MFLLAGIILLAALILFVLYYYIFTKVHKILGIIILIIISLALMFTMFMHLIITGIIVLAAGLFLIKMAEYKKTKVTAK